MSVLILEKTPSEVSISGLNELPCCLDNMMLGQLQIEPGKQHEKKVVLNITEIQALNILTRLNFSIVSQAYGPNSVDRMSWTLMRK